MSDDLVKMEKLARAATPGPWAMVPAGNRPEIMCGYRSGWGSLAIARVESIQFLQDAAFIAAANPATVLSMVATIRTLQEQVKKARNDALEEANKQTQELKDKLQRVGEAIPDRKELADHGMMVCDDISRRIRSLKDLKP